MRSPSTAEQASRSSLRPIPPPAHHIQQPIAEVLVTAELDAHGAVRVVELGLLGSGEIPVTNNIEIRRNFVDDDTPCRLK
jgi:uncharacterized protein (DUF2342 family)